MTNTMKLKKKGEELLRRAHDSIFLSYKHKLKREVGDCESLLDVGCGENSPVQFLDDAIYKVGVDVFAPAIEKSKQREIHDEYHEMNVLEIEEKFSPQSFECVVASDLIEHLTKEDGYKLLEMMEKIAKKKVVVFTPQGFVPQGVHENNPWQVHKSGWSMKEMNDRGYEVRGINGWKGVWGWSFLWKKHDSANFIVRVFRKFLLEASQLFVRFFPQYAYQILCTKVITRGST